MLTATQHLLCTPHRPTGAAAFDPAWRTETVMALARGITHAWAFDRLPILADALEEAGCDDFVLLRHCRECQHHTARCWVLGDLFDRPPEPDPPRLSEDDVRREVELITGRRMEPAARYDGNTSRPFIDWQRWAWTLVPVFVLIGLFNIAKWWVRIDPARPQQHPSFAPKSNPQPTFPLPR